MTMTDPGPTAPTRRAPRASDGRWVFSVSAAESYGRCPLQFAERYARSPDQRTDPVTDVPRRRGIVLHDALKVALDSARIEVEGRGFRAGGGRMSRYWHPARVELGQSWQRNRMPSDSAEAELVVDLLRTTLDAVRIPLPGAMHGVEAEREHLIDDNIVIVYKPDWTLWTGPKRLRVVDWKTGKVGDGDVDNHTQLLAYAAWLAELLGPAVTSMEIELFSMRTGIGHVRPVDPGKAARAAQRVERAARTAFADTEYLPKVGPHCSGCFYRATCPAVGLRPEPGAA